MVGRAAAACLALALLAGCGSSPDTPAVPSPSPATTETAENRSPSQSPDRPLVLGFDGIGSHVFGDEPDDVVAGVTDALGQPDEDSGWEPTDRQGCAEADQRLVRWGRLTLAFTDADTSYDHGGRRHFNAYTVTDHRGATGPDVRTAEGGGWGDTVASMKRAYGSKLKLEDDPPLGPHGVVWRGEADRIFFGLSSIDDDGVVGIVAGGHDICEWV